MSYADETSSDDEIVWNGCGESDISLSTDSSIFPSSDDDFVVLSRPRSHRSTGLSTPNTVRQAMYSDEVLVSRLSRLGLDDFPSSRHTPVKTLSLSRADGQRKNSGHAPQSQAPGLKKRRVAPGSVHKSASKSYPSAPASPNLVRPSSASRPTHVPKKYKSKKAKKKFATKSRAAGAGLGSRPIVDDISEKASDNGEEIGTMTIHEEAANYITSFLANPQAKNSVCHLTLLQSLIIELGLTSCTPIIPSSLTKAKALLKSRAFLNIREYLAVRDQGQAALRRVMHPSRLALIKDIKSKKNPANLKWVKQNGLQVFLVSCFH